MCGVNLDKKVWIQETRFLGSPCHAGHAAGCHYGTSSSPLWRRVCGCCSIQLCTVMAPVRSGARIVGRLTGFICGRRGGAAGAPDGRTGPLWLSIVTGNELQGHGEERQGARVFVWVGFASFSAESEEKWGFPKRDGAFVRRSHFWSFNLVNWPPRQTDAPPTTTPPRPLLLLVARAHSPPSQPLYGLLSNPPPTHFSPCNLLLSALSSLLL